MPSVSMDRSTKPTFTSIDFAFEALFTKSVNMIMLRRLWTVSLAGWTVLLRKITAEMTSAICFAGETASCETEVLERQELCPCAISTENGTSMTPTWRSKKCRVWLAKSTIPNAGLAVFSGQTFAVGDTILDIGDHTIPIVDFSLFHGKGYEPVWQDYTWKGYIARADNEGLLKVEVISCGIGAVANCILDFQNIEEGRGVQSIPVGMHRAKDPGAGAFTEYHSRFATAKTDIEAGAELFVSYGRNWYVTRMMRILCSF